jgi:DNA-binding NarL/FixJ family response regulator
VRPSIPPVLLTIYKDDDRIFQAICACACGYLLKTTGPARLLQTVTEIAILVVDLFRKTSKYPSTFPRTLLDGRVR